MIQTKIYDYLIRHRILMVLSLTLITITMSILVMTLRYNENINDFLPLGSEESEALAVYQDVSGADQVIVLFNNPDDEDLTIEAIDEFSRIVFEGNSELAEYLTTQYDSQSIHETMDFVYDNIPYFLRPEDYSHIDSLLSSPGYMESCLAQNKKTLMMPIGSIASSTILHDPLGLFSNVMNDLQGSSPQVGFELIDGYIFTPDLKKAIVLWKSPFGGSETEMNSRAINLFHDAAKQIEHDFEGVSVSLTGGPVIAVGNSSRIKTDSVIAIGLSAILIIILLVFAFNSLRNILLILISIGWGWLFAVGGIAIFRDQVSIIVIGISSVILGIAVNYPLHLIAHAAHQKNMRSVLKDISEPLIIGNITTVGAFLALVPLQSVALRDLGLFASLLLVGTILFVIIYLPHFVKTDTPKVPKTSLIPKLARFSPEKSRALLFCVLVLTVIFSVFGLNTRFDSDLSNINYMTEEQSNDIQYFQSLLASDQSENTCDLYVMSYGTDFNEALSISEQQQKTINDLIRSGKVKRHKGVNRFLVSKDEQVQRLHDWSAFAEDFRNSYADQFLASCISHGFNNNAFKPFMDLMYVQYEPQDYDYFSVITSGVLNGHLSYSADKGRAYVLDIISCDNEHTKEAIGCFENCFDIVGINSTLAHNLSDNFNYIGWFCSLIVFLFLWISFGQLELALISFLPMAISWIWILGAMSLFGIQFNIVNVILATFIFGQGDDYTIFMTEGCQYEYTYRKPILESYKSSIIQSALIMFVGIGTLIVAKHPAMRSLAQVTIIGMASVVFMAFFIPPLFFKWITMKDGKVREHPITISTIIYGAPNDPKKRVIGRYMYKGANMFRSVKKSLVNAEEKMSLLKSNESGKIIVRDDNFGEFAIYVALRHPDTMVSAIMLDDEKMLVAINAAEGFVDNITFNLS